MRPRPRRRSVRSDSPCAHCSATATALRLSAHFSGQRPGVGSDRRTRDRRVLGHGLSSNVLVPPRGLHDRFHRLPALLGDLVLGVPIRYRTRGPLVARRSVADANALRPGTGCAGPLPHGPTPLSLRCHRPVRIAAATSRSNRPNDAFAASARFSPPFSAAFVNNAATTAPNVNNTGCTTNTFQRADKNSLVLAGLQ